MKTGTDKVSGQQKQLLERAQRRLHPRELAEVLHRIAIDDDLRSGKEEVHPEWLDIYERGKESISRYVPAPVAHELQEFFENLAPHDRCVSELDPRNLNVTFLLGAGASKPAPSNIPTVKELLPQLLERARRLDREDVTKLADFCDRRKIDNIEDLLTAAQIATFTSRNPTVLRLVNYLLYRRETEEPGDENFFTDPWIVARRVREARPGDPAADLSSVAFLQDTLQVLFGLLASTMLPAQPNKAHEAIAAYSRSHKHAAVVTTNYDCCMDLALGDVDLPSHYRIEFANKRSESQNGSHDARLVKLHGSLNWYYCETCQEVQLVDIRTLISQYQDDTAPYPVIGICKDCGGQRRGLLVPPLAMKFDVAPPLTPLLSEARDAFDKADMIVVVGFSFAEADVYISRMLSKSMQTSAAQKLVVVDPDRRVVERIRRKFKASIPNFDPARIVRMSGDCADVLPRFLKGEFVAAKAMSPSEEKRPKLKQNSSKGTHEEDGVKKPSTSA